MSLLSGINFIPNPMGIAMIARSTMMETMLKGAAEAIAVVVRQIGPSDVGNEPQGLGYMGIRAEVDPVPYVNQISVASGVKEGVVMARVNADKFTSNWIEFGTGEPGPTPAFAPLRRAAESVGLRLVSKK